MKNITLSAYGTLIEAARDRAHAEHTTLNEPFRRCLADYAGTHDASDPGKQAIAARIVRQALTGGNACISDQGIQECLNTVLRKAQVALDIAQGRAYLEAVLARRFGFCDSLIVAAVLAADCTHLLREDFDMHGQKIETLTIHDLFRG